MNIYKTIIISISTAFLFLFGLIAYNISIPKIEYFNNLLENNLWYVISTIFNNFITPLTLIVLSVGLLSLKKTGWYVSQVVLILLMVYLNYYFLSGSWRFSSTQYDFDFYQLYGKYILGMPIVNYLFHLVIYTLLIVLLFNKELRRKYMSS